MNAQLQSQTAGEFRLLINGRLVDGASTFDVINPATEEPLAKCPRADLGQLNQAVAAAKAAFPAWAARPIAERRALILKFADAMESSLEDVARLLTQEQGKPLGAARGELFGAVYIIRTIAQLDLPVQVLREGNGSRIVRRSAPLGVIAAITPWNFPVILLATKLAPALLAGNTLVAKPAPTTPLTTLRLGEIAASVFPAGVVNTIADVNDLGAALTAHPDVAKVAFTGSTATGRKVMASAAGTVKRVTLELGGNDAAIVLDDMDPKEAAAKLFASSMVNSGQVCMAAKRAYVPDTLYDAVCAELVKLAEAAVIGNGLDADTQFGPLQNATQYKKVQEYIEDARARGKIIAGGKPHEGRGYFVRPTIVRDIPDDSRLVQEEQFGPVLPVLRYTDIDDAITRANSTEYGLAGTVWSKDPQRAFEVAMKLDTGTVWINKHLDLPADVPYGGARQSGLGSEMGQEGLEEYTQAHIVNVAL